MRDKPWTHVLEWFGDQTGMPVILGENKPTGTLSFYAPKEGGEAKKYTLAEVLDLLNDELLKQKMLLIRRSGSFTVVAADSKIPPELVPLVPASDLEQYGK